MLFRKNTQQTSSGVKWCKKRVVCARVRVWGEIERTPACYAKMHINTHSYSFDVL